MTFFNKFRVVTFCAAIGVVGNYATGEECNYALDMLLAQDASGSFASSLENTAAAMTDLMAQLETRHVGSRFKLTTFTDLPLWPLGCNDADGAFQDSPFTDHTEWTTDSKVISNALKTMGTDWGVDMDEAQLTHLAHVCDTGLFNDIVGSDTRPKLQKVVVMPTDAEYHKAGSLLRFVSEERRETECNSGAAEATDGKRRCCTLDGNFSFDDYLPNPPALFTFDRESNTYFYRDYPTLDYTVKRLVEEDISLIFLLMPPADAASVPYIEFVQKMLDQGGYATIVELKESSSNLYDAVTAGLENLSDYVCKEDPVIIATTTVPPTTTPSMSSTTTLMRTVPAATTVPTTVAVPTTADEPMIPPVVVPPPVEEPTTADESMIPPVIVPPVNEPTTPTTDETTTTSTTTTTTEKPVPVGLIVGASVGAVAALGAVGALVGTSMFGAAGGAGGTMNATDVGDVAEAPEKMEEREGMQDISTEMFA